MREPAARPTASPPGRPLLRRILAFLPPLAAVALQLALWPVIRPSVWFLFYPAIFLSSWLGGLRAALVACLTWWGFGLPYSMLVWLLDERQMRWTLICYAWEVPAAGFFGPVLFPQLWWRRIERRWAETFDGSGDVDPERVAAVEGMILDYPLRVGWVLFFTSVIGYLIGGLQLGLFAQLPAQHVVRGAAQLFVFDQHPPRSPSGVRVDEQFAQAVEADLPAHNVPQQQVRRPLALQRLIPHLQHRPARRPPTALARPIGARAGRVNRYKTPAAAFVDRHQ